MSSGNSPVDDESSIIWSLPVMTIPPEESYDYYGFPRGGFEPEIATSSTEFPLTSTHHTPGNGNLSELWANSSLFPGTDIFNDNCTEALQHVTWSDPGLISSLVILVMINGLVVAGNVLVIIAVFTTPKLRTVTNLFIASLAVADLLLGMAVLPFSVTVEVFHTWLFGELWCSVWLAVDVWMSTSSILNLCVISLDRYVAVTRPVKYPSLMTSKKAKLLIAGVWIASFVICFPPLVGWNDRHKNLMASESDCALNCELTNDIGYVLYSAMGSFFLPMLVMMFFYYKIYLAAIETTRAIKRGFKTTTKKGTEQVDESRVTLRIHVGTRNNSLQGQSRATAATRARRFSSVKLPGPKGGLKKIKAPKFSSSCHFDPFEDNSSKSSTKREGMELVSLTREKSVLGKKDSSAQSTNCDNGSVSSIKNRGTSRKKNIKVQVKRFRMETKAAKTLGIIVGVFIVCWFPFFTMYLVRAFCVDCINPLLFSVFFWLGYCNSAINPCIYALFSKDFRFAFKKILCKVICRKERRKWPLPLPGMYLAAHHASLGDDSDELEDMRI